MRPATKATNADTPNPRFHIYLSPLLAHRITTKTNLSRPESGLPSAKAGLSNTKPLTLSSSRTAFKEGLDELVGLRRAPIPVARPAADKTPFSVQKKGRRGRWNHEDPRDLIGLVDEMGEGQVVLLDIRLHNLLTRRVNRDGQNDEPLVLIF